MQFLRTLPVSAFRLPSPLNKSAARFASAMSGSVPAVAPAETTDALRLRAIKLYKEVETTYGFNKRLRRAYEKNAKNTDPVAMMKQLELAEHIKKEVLALISLKKYRHLRRSYHANEPPR